MEIKKKMFGEEYFQMHTIESSNIENYKTNQDIQTSIRDVFEKAVEKRLMSDRPIGCY